MSLLEVITKASTNRNEPDPETSYPIVLNPDPVFITLKPENCDSNEKNLVKLASGWKISEHDTEIIEVGQTFFKKLKRKVKNYNGFYKDEFLDMFNSYLEQMGEKNGILIDFERSDEGYNRKLVEKVGFLMGRDVKGLVLEACVLLEAWDILEGLILNRLVEHSCSSNLVHNLIEKRRSDLIVLCIKHLPDLQTYDIMCILKYFLLTPEDGLSTMVSVGKEWESQALLAIEKVSDKSLSGKKANLAKDASLLIMVAYDGFSVSELCLHYLLSSKNLDEVILSACISKLNGSEIVGLIKYLGKWLKKYERFPQVGPCQKASSFFGLKACEWIPMIEDVVKCLGLVVDEHFSSLVLNPEFHEELRLLGGTVTSLAAEARLCGSITNLVDSLRSELKEFNGNLETSLQIEFEVQTLVSKMMDMGRVLNW